MAKFSVGEDDWKVWEFHAVPARLRMRLLVKMKVKAASFVLEINNSKWEHVEEKAMPILSTWKTQWYLLAKVMTLARVMRYHEVTNPGSAKIVTPTSGVTARREGSWKGLASL